MKKITSDGETEKKNCKDDQSKKIETYFKNKNSNQFHVNVIQNKPRDSQGNDLHGPCLAPVISLILQQV